MKRRKGIPHQLPMRISILLLLATLCCGRRREDLRSWSDTSAIMQDRTNFKPDFGSPAFRPKNMSDLNIYTGPAQKPNLYTKDPKSKTLRKSPVKKWQYPMETFLQNLVGKDQETWIKILMDSHKRPEFKRTSLMDAGSKNLNYILKDVPVENIEPDNIKLAREADTPSSADLTNDLSPEPIKEMDKAADVNIDNESPQPVSLNEKVSSVSADKEENISDDHNHTKFSDTIVEEDRVGGKELDSTPTSSSIDSATESKRSHSYPQLNPVKSYVERMRRPAPGNLVATKSEDSFDLKASSGSVSKSTADSEFGLDQKNKVHFIEPAVTNNFTGESLKTFSAAEKERLEEAMSSYFEARQSAASENSDLQSADTVSKKSRSSNSHGNAEGKARTSAGSSFSRRKRSSHNFFDDIVLPISTDNTSKTASFHSAEIMSGKSGLSYSHGIVQGKAGITTGSSSSRRKRSSHNFFDDIVLPISDDKTSFNGYSKYISRNKSSMQDFMPIDSTRISYTLQPTLEQKLDSFIIEEEKPQPGSSGNDQETEIKSEDDIGMKNENLVQVDLETIKPWDVHFEDISSGYEDSDYSSDGEDTKQVFDQRGMLVHVQAGSDDLKDSDVSEVELAGSNPEDINDKDSHDLPANHEKSLVVENAQEPPRPDIFKERISVDKKKISSSRRRSESSLRKYFKAQKSVKKKRSRTAFDDLSLVNAAPSDSLGVENSLADSSIKVDVKDDMKLDTLCVPRNSVDETGHVDSPISLADTSEEHLIKVGTEPNQKKSKSSDIIVEPIPSSEKISTVFSENFYVSSAEMLPVEGKPLISPARFINPKEIQENDENAVENEENIDLSFINDNGDLTSAESVLSETEENTELPFFTSVEIFQKSTEISDIAGSQKIMEPLIDEIKDLKEDSTSEKDDVVTSETEEKIDTSFISPEPSTEKCEITEESDDIGDPTPTISVDLVPEVEDEDTVVLEAEIVTVSNVEPEGITISKNLTRNTTTADTKETPPKPSSEPSIAPKCTSSFDSAKTRIPRIISPPNKARTIQNIPHRPKRSKVEKEIYRLRIIAGGTVCGVLSVFSTLGFVMYSLSKTDIDPLMTLFY